MQQQIEQVKAKVQQCIAAAEAKFGITMPKVQIRFDLKGRAAGIAGYRGDNFYVRFNVQHMALGGQTWEHLLNDTVPHELAHTVCQAFPQFGRNHDAGWKRVCVALGGNGRRCYSEDDAPEAVAAARPYVYITTNGHEVRVTKVMHTKIQRGSTYTVRGKGGLNAQCQYNYMAAPVANKPIVKQVKQAAPAKPAAAPAAKGSKADAIRAMIRNGNTEAEVIHYAVSVLGMTRTLARTYYKNNLNKA